MLTTSRCFR